MVYNHHTDIYSRTYIFILTQVLEDEEPPELSEPSKKDIKAAKKRALEKRKEDPDAGATTDDELEMAGFMPQE